MTYREIFTEIFRKNKRYIIFCITLCMVFSMFAFGGSPTVNADDMSSAELSSSLGGSFGKLIAPVLGVGYFGGIDTSWTMVLLSFVSICSSLGREVGIAPFRVLNNYSFGIFENQTCAWLLFIWFGLPLLMKATGKTDIMGIALENFKKLNGAVVTVVIISQMIANAQPKSIVKAAGVGSEGVSKGIGVLTCFFVLIVTLIVYYLVRYMFGFIDIVMIPVCTLVPFMSVFMVIAKFLGICILLLMAKYLPGAFIFIMILTVIVAALVFRTAYMATRYFENIYAKPLLRRIFKGFDQNMPLTTPKVPKYVGEYLNGRNVQLLIPVYILQSIPNMKSMHKWERWWMVTENGRTYLLRKPAFHGEYIQIPLEHTPAQKIFINQFLTYHEIFNIYGSEENIVKKLKRVPKYSHIVFSREYKFRYQDILNITGFVDYKGYRDYLTAIANGQIPYTPR